ncbi:unnamed protein product, partial [Urochloa humidicola]
PPFHPCRIKKFPRSSSNRIAAGGINSPSTRAALPLGFLRSFPPTPPPQFLPPAADSDFGEIACGCALPRERRGEKGEMGYIGHHGVATLRRYKYSGVDHSLVAKYILQPFWSRFVNVFPLWFPLHSQVSCFY